MTIEEKLNWLIDNCPEEVAVTRNEVYIIDSLWTESGTWCFAGFSIGSLDENLDSAIEWSKIEKANREIIND